MVGGSAKLMHQKVQSECQNTIQAGLSMSIFDISEHKQMYYSKEHSQSQKVSYAQHPNELYSL